VLTPPGVQKFWTLFESKKSHQNGKVTYLSSMNE